MRYHQTYWSLSLPGRWARSLRSATSTSSSPLHFLPLHPHHCPTHLLTPLFLSSHRRPVGWGWPVSRPCWSPRSSTQALSLWRYPNCFGTSLRLLFNLVVIFLLFESIGNWHLVMMWHDHSTRLPLASYCSCPGLGRTSKCLTPSCQASAWTSQTWWMTVRMI